MSIEFTIDGLNPRQKALADIMWGLRDRDQVDAFMAALPLRDRRDCEAIIELMKMAMLEQCYTDCNSHMPEAASILNQFTL